VLALSFGVALALPAGVAGIAGAAAGAGCAVVLALLVRRWLGGVTGDVLGATAKLAETAFLVTALGVVS
jgi:adenosylcobinamide-GDP ribazoletransferase